MGVGGGAARVHKDDVVVLLPFGTGIAGAEGGAEGGFGLGGGDPRLGGLGGIVGLVEDGFPHQEAGAGAVAAHHRADVIEHAHAEKGLFVPELPAGGVLDDEEPHLVAGIHEGGVLQVVGVADEGEAGFAELHGIAVVEEVAEGVAHEGEVLVAVGSDEFAPRLAVEDEPLLGGDGGLAEAEPHVHRVGARAVGGAGLHAQEVEVRRVRRPLGGLLHHKGLGDFLALIEAAHGALAIERHLRRHLPLAFLEALGGEVDAALGAGRGNGHRAGLHQPHVAIDAAEVGEVEVLLGLAGRVVTVVGIVALHAQHVALRLQFARHLHMDGVEAAEALAHLLAVEEDLALAHDGLEVEELPRALGREVEALFIGGGALPIAAAGGLKPHHVERVRQVHPHLIAIAAHEVPPHVHARDGAGRPFGREVARLRELRGIGQRPKRHRRTQCKRQHTQSFVLHTHHTTITWQEAWGVAWGVWGRCPHAPGRGCSPAPALKGLTELHTRAHWTGHHAHRAPLTRTGPPARTQDSTHCTPDTHRAARTAPCSPRTASTPRAIAHCSLLPAHCSLLIENRRPRPLARPSVWGWPLSSLYLALRAALMAAWAAARRAIGTR